MEKDNTTDTQNDYFSKSVKAGKRTYFFDIKSTRGNDFYLTITESKRSNDGTGDPSFVKHKLFLYKEDFDKFTEGLHETIQEAKRLYEKHNK